MNVFFFFTTPHNILSYAKTYPLHPTPPHYSPHRTKTFPTFFTSHHPTRDIYIASSNITKRIICSWRDPIPTLIIPSLYPIFLHSNRRPRSLLVLHSLSLSLSLIHSFLLVLSLVHMNTSKHTDLRKIFFSFSLENGIQFCAIIGTPY